MSLCYCPNNPNQNPREVVDDDDSKPEVPKNPMMLENDEGDQMNPRIIIDKFIPKKRLLVKDEEDSFVVKRRRVDDSEEEQINPRIIIDKLVPKKRVFVKDENDEEDPVVIKKRKISKTKNKRKLPISWLRLISLTRRLNPDVTDEDIKSYTNGFIDEIRKTYKEIDYLGKTIPKTEIYQGIQHQIIAFKKLKQNKTVSEENAWLILRKYFN